MIIWWNYNCIHVRSDVSIRLSLIIPVTLPSLVLLTINDLIFLIERQSDAARISNPNFKKSLWTSSKEMFRLCKFLETAIWIAPKLLWYLDVRVALKVRSLLRTWASSWVEPQLYNLLGLYIWQNCMNIFT